MSALATLARSRPMTQWWSQGSASGAASSAKSCVNAGPDLTRLAQRTGKPVDSLSEDAMRVLLTHDFPGNVRELENAIEHAFVLCHAGAIGPEHLPRDLALGTSQLLSPTDLSPRAEAEADLIRRTLARHKGNRAATALELRLHRATLWRKIRQYGLATGPGAEPSGRE
jgi:DNA-binding NtrC family response regulator